MLYPEICYSGKEKEEGEIKERMSPQDKVERVLKEIHVTFSKSEMVDGHPDKVIIDRKKFLGLLDRLNQGIYDMMDQYEQTRQSRNNAERAFRKKGDEIIIAVSNCIKRIFGGEGVCYRTFGDEFCVIITDPGPEAGESVWSEQLAFEMSHITRNGLYEVTLYWGSSFIRDENGKMKTVSDWKFEADTKLNEHRQVKISKNK